MQRGHGTEITTCVTNLGSGSCYFRCLDHCSSDMILTALVATFKSKMDEDEFWFPYLDSSMFGPQIPVRMPWLSLAPGNSIRLKKRSFGTIIGSEVANEARIEFCIVDWLGRKATVCSESFDVYALPDLEELPNHALDPK